MVPLEERVESVTCGPHIWRVQWRAHTFTTTVAP